MRVASFPGGRVTHSPPTRARRLKGYSANRRAYDARRRAVVHTPADEVFKAVLQVDPCCICGSREGRVRDVDHIVPLNAGGADGWENMTAACLRCNRGRKDTSLLHYLLRKAT